MVVECTCQGFFPVVSGDEVGEGGVQVGGGGGMGDPQKAVSFEAVHTPLPKNAPKPKV
jgi:hypothetical protein